MNSLALKALRMGIPVLIHDSDSREDEVDYVVHGFKASAAKIREMRKTAGGLICFAMPYNYGRVLGLDFMHHIVKSGEVLSWLFSKKTPYGGNSAFSISVNSLWTRTGIRDNDRSLTITLLSKVVELLHRGLAREAKNVFSEEFYAPGHVPILLGQDIRERQGHTELALALAELAGLPPGMVLVEMLSDDGEQLASRDARRLAESRGWVFLESFEIIEEYERRRGL